MVYYERELQQKLMNFNRMKSDKRTENAFADT